jgi:hypothetical protein
VRWILPSLLRGQASPHCVALLTAAMGTSPSGEIYVRARADGVFERYLSKCQAQGKPLTGFEITAGRAGTGPYQEAALADLREGLELLIEEVGPPDEMTLTLDVA